MGIFKPDLTVDSLAEIDLKKYWEKGKRGIILDLDNTIVLWQETKLVEKARIFLEKALALNYRVCLLSNAGTSRVKKIAEKHELPYLALALKPRKSVFRKALAKLKLTEKEVLVIGDQIFTDIWGGNRVGCETILVSPLEKKEFMGTKVLRFLEYLVKRKFKGG